MLVTVMSPQRHEQRSYHVHRFCVLAPGCQRNDAVHTKGESLGVVLRAVIQKPKPRPCQALSYLACPVGATCGTCTHNHDVAQRYAAGGGWGWLLVLTTLPRPLVHLRGLHEAEKVTAAAEPAVALAATQQRCALRALLANPADTLGHSLVRRGHRPAPR